METLRVFDVSCVPTPDETAQPFARVPVSALRDPDLSDAAVRMLAGVMSLVWSGAIYCYATNEELGRIIGKSPRAARRLLAELVERRLFDLETDPAKTGRPRRIVLLFRLKPSGSTAVKPGRKSPESPPEGRPGGWPEVSTPVASGGHPRGQKCPPPWPAVATPLVLDGLRGKETLELRAPTSSPRAVSRPPASPSAKQVPEPEPEAPPSAELLEELRSWSKLPAQDWRFRWSRRCLDEYEARGLIDPESLGQPAGESSGNFPPRPVE